MSETAFVVGATGYTGREVVRALVRAGHRAIAHVRPDSPHLEEWRDRFRGLGAEVDETAFYEDDFAATLRELRPSAVFALLGTTRKRAASEGRDGPTAYQAVDYGLTALVRRAAERCAAAPRFVYLSSMGVTGQTRNAYLAARARVEAELQAGALPYTIVRPGIISGPDRDEARPAERASAVVLDGVATALGVVGLSKMRRRLSSTTSEVLAAELVRLAFDPAAARQVIESEDLRKR